MTKKENKMRLLRLEHSSIDITVSDEVYEHIVQFVEAYQIEDYHLYKVASELASAAYDRARSGGADEHENSTA